MAEASKTTPEVTLDEIVALCKRRGFIFQASEIYGGLASTYDYGHYGVLLKNNVKAEWWRAMVGERDDIVALDSAILQHPRVWEASGHLEGFTDPLVDCRTCKLRFRADDLENAQCGRKPSLHPGEYSECDLTDPRQFNLMFKTHMGPVEDDAAVAYLRPETAQGIFINFKNVLQFARRKPPFGIAQVGKSFRNEITPGNFVFRTREFEQMEMEYFVPPGRGPEVVRVLARRAGALVHGARASGPTTCACASTTPRSSRTTRRPPPTSSTCSRSAGPSSRGSPTAATSTSPSTRSSPARSSSTSTRSAARPTSRTSSSRPPAPTARRSPSSSTPTTPTSSRVESARCCASTPAWRRSRPRCCRWSPRPGCPSGRARSTRSVRSRVPAEYDEGGSIGKRYRRQDEIGTPWGITVDGQTLEDGTVTLRDRDTLEQERVAADEIADRLAAKLAEPWQSPKLA